MFPWPIFRDVDSFEVLGLPLKRGFVEREVTECARVIVDNALKPFLIFVVIRNFDNVAYFERRIHREVRWNGVADGTDSTNSFERRVVLWRRSC